MGDLNSPAFSFGSDELVGLSEMPAEAIVGIDETESTGVPGDFSVEGVLIPESLAHEKVVVFKFSCKRTGRDVENGVTSVEVIVVSLGLDDAAPPGGVVGVGVEGVVGVGPGLIKSLDRIRIVLLSHGQNEVVVSHHSTVS